jgi:hypothetical protein
MKKIIFPLLLILLSTNACGFKVVNQSELTNFSIQEINTAGDKRINYKIRNKLLSLSKKEGNKFVKLKINTTKNKTIKEKNIKNEITKYQMTIKIVIEISDTNFDKINLLTVSKSGDYNVATQHSQTLRNEKKLIELLTDSLIQKILEELSIRINDL